MKQNELACRLSREGFRSDAYSLDGGLPALLEGYVLRRLGVLWTIEYYERGLTRTLAQFSSEDEACDAMYATLNADPTTRV